MITRACAPDPQQRYASATELQADLNLFLSGRSLRQVRIVERNVVRLRQLALAAGAVLLLVIVALWFSKRSERQARQRAREANQRAQTEATLRRRAETAEQDSRLQLYSALLEQARATVRSGELGQRFNALDAIRRAAAISNTVELRREAVAALGLLDLRFERELPLGADVNLAVLDPKFERMAVGCGNGGVEIRSVPDQELLTTLPASIAKPATFARWSPDGRYLAVRRGQIDNPSDTTTHIEVWDVLSSRQVLSLPDTPQSGFAFHPSLPRMLGADTGNSVSL